MVEETRVTPGESHMIIELPWTEDTDLVVGFGEAVVFFDPPEELPESLSIPVWGIDVDGEVFRGLGLDFDGDVYVAGKSVIHLEGVKGGGVDHSLYWGPDFDRCTLHPPDPGLIRVWLGSMPQPPHRYVELHFDVARAWAEIPLQHCVHGHDYIFHPRLYGWHPLRATGYTGVKKEWRWGEWVRISWKNGMPDGICMRWDRNGRLISKSDWRRGRLHGQWTKWWSNGQVRFQSRYEWGIETECMEWDEQGKLLDHRKRAPDDPLLVKFRELYGGSL
jgi:hypothetical protein